MIKILLLIFLIVIITHQQHLRVFSETMLPCYAFNCSDVEMISAPFLHLHQHWINILIKLWENSLELDNSLRVNTTDEDEDDDDDLDAEYSVDVFVSEARTVKTADISPGSDRGMRLDNGSNDIKTRQYLDISAPAIMQWMNITHAEKQSLLEYFIINLCHPLQ